VNKYCNSDFKITLLIFKSPDLNPLGYHVWVRYWDATRSWRLLCYRYGM